MKKGLINHGIAIIGIAVLAFFAIASTVENEDPDSPGGGGGGGGNTNPRNSAKLVTVGYSESHTISSSGEHWFKFVADGNPVIFETEGNVVATTIEIYEGESWFGSSSYGGAGSNALCGITTTAETTYYIKITARNSTNGTYTFVVKAPTSNLRANPISVAVGNSTSHTIFSSGTHWFSFAGTGDRVFFETDGNVVNTDIRLYFGDSTSSSYSGREGINFITVTGQTYYINITGNSGTYTFKVRNGDGDGSSRYNAKTVTNGYSGSYTITSSGEHWFMYQGTGNPVIFETEGNVVATTIEIYEGESWFGSSSYGGAGSNALCRVTTTLGTTYRIKITARQSTYGEYTFVVKQE